MRLSISLLVLSLALPVFAEPLAGFWYTEDKESIVEIARDGEGVYSGRIVWLAEPLYTEDDDVGPERIGQPKYDLNNPDSARHTQPIVGLTILRDFTGRNGRWDGGTIYDPNNGRTYRCTMRLDRNGRLLVRGYIGISAFGRSTTWERAPEKEAREHLGEGESTAE